MNPSKKDLSQIPCVFYKSGGGCRYGNFCSYSHSEELQEELIKRRERQLKDEKELQEKIHLNKLQQQVESVKLSKADRSQQSHPVTQLEYPKSSRTFFDIGLNLTANQYKKDYMAVVQRAYDRNVRYLCLTGSNLKNSYEAQNIIKSYGNFKSCLYYTAGFHPHEAKNCGPEELKEILKMASEDDNCVAIGECGLDFDRNFSDPKVQETCFEDQLKIAVALKKPVFVHERTAFKNVYELLCKFKDSLPAIVIHCFTGTEEELNAYIGLGCYIGVTGWICDERRGLELQKIIKKIPQDRLMIETDGPYLIPRTIKNFKAIQRNEPCLLPFVADCVASCLGSDVETVADITTKNAKRFFGIQ